eukprot:TRINITY_DN8825_c0_g1_i1.p1 TRINITY_DN8825_c0_g1~~TRINITY_DN8825_c0_g1_i1.p1  ORF type:complete len:217 (+),score=26.26 TRINITY_DN8825_c0_g1_i1:141-791(+)
MRGSLLWQGVNINNKQERYDKIMQYKMELSLSTMCSGLPEEMVKYMRYCRNLNFDQTPDYQALKKLFGDYMIGRKWNIGFQFDWDLAKSEEGHKKLKGLDFANNKGIRVSTCESKNILNALDKKEIRRDALMIPEAKAGIHSSLNESNVAEKDVHEDRVHSGEPHVSKTSEVEEGDLKIIIFRGCNSKCKANKVFGSGAYAQMQECLASALSTCGH